MAKKKLNYSQSITELEDILEALQNQEVSVDQLSEKVKRASELIDACSSMLKKTEDEVSKLLKDED
ncbi:MAG: exodeoxyribonuclease VII small subunit [Flavobacteriales bacterium]